MKSKITLLLFAFSLFWANTPEPYTYAVLSRPACIRPIPKLSATCSLNIASGEKTILRSGLVNNFYKVQYRGRIGWIHKSRVNLIYP